MYRHFEFIFNQIGGMNIRLKSINYLLDITDIIYCLYISVESYIFYILKNKLQRLSPHDFNVNLEKFGVT